MKRSASSFSLTALLFLGIGTSFVAAQNPAPVQTFYLPLPEPQVLTGLSALAVGSPGTAPVNPMQRYAGISSVGTNTVIYYDQAENGYEVDISAPASTYNATTNRSGTQIWGDGNTNNGVAPGFPTDIIPAGGTVILSNQVTTTNQPTVAAPLFNGGDKIASSKAVAITTTLWASGSRTLQTDAVEVYDTFNWGTNYRVPLGTNISTPTSAFEYVGASVMAGPNGATVRVDADANGTFETTNNLTQGQSFFINGGLRAGAQVSANNPVQVDVMTGDIGSEYESRWFRLLPTSLWSSSYYTPVSTPPPNGTTVWLYNPATNAINVTYATRNLSNAVVNVANKGVAYTNPVVLTNSPAGSVYGTIRELSANGNITNTTNSPGGAWIGIVNRSATTSIADQVANARSSGLVGGGQLGPSAIIIVSTNNSTNFTSVLTDTPIPVVGLSSNQGAALRAAGLGAGWVRVSGNQVTNNIVVPAGGVTNQVVGTGYGARFFAPGGQNFYAFSGTDTVQGSGEIYDWGFSLVPQTSLTPQALVGLGFGRDPTSSTRPNENGSPIWVSTVGNPNSGNDDVLVYIDYDSDPTTGPLTDPNGYKYDTTITLRQFEKVEVFNPSGNQSGMLLYTLTPGVRLVTAWGQDSLLAATNGQPGFDGGTGVPPLPQFTASKKSSLFLDVDGDGFVSPGDQIEYELSIQNISRVPLSDMTAQDTLPASVDYLANSTTFTSHTGATQAIPDNASAPVFPLTTTRTMPVATLPPGQTWNVKYRVVIKSYAALPPGTTSIINSAVVNSISLNEPVNLQEQQPLFGRIGDRVWVDTNGNGIQDSGEPGLNGVTVNLLDSSGNPVLDANLNPRTTTTVTNSGSPGFYQFTGVQGGNYIIQFVTPSGYVFTTQNADSAGISGTANSDASRTNGRSGSFTLGAGQTSNFVDAGMYQPGTISGTVRRETTGDLVGDVGQSGVVLTLQDGSGNNIDSDPGTAGVQPTTTTSAANGTYSFGSLPPGNYRVVQTVPGGFNAIGDADGGNFTVIGNVTPITIVSGSTITGRDFVNQGPGGISGFVRTDTDGNGSGDTAQASVTVTLKDSSGNDIDSNPGTPGVQPTTTTTSVTGAYSFANLPPGNYRVVQTVPGGFAAIGDVDGGNLTVIGDVTLISVLPETTVANQNFVNRQAGAITGTVRSETTGDLVGDVAQSGVVLTLLDSSGNNIDSDPGTAGVQPTTTTSAANGTYSFANIPPGNYRVAQTVPSGFTAIGDADGGNFTVIGNVTPINVLPGATVSGRDFVNQAPGTISGTVRADTVGNGTGDVGLANVVVTLRDSSGNDIDSDPGTAGVQPTTRTTPANGTYSFANIPPGNYRVVQTVPSGYVAINDVDGGDPTVIGSVTAINVLPGATVSGRDFVDAQRGSIAGTVRTDTDGNSTGDTAQSGVVLTLQDSSGNNIDSDPGTAGVQPTTTTSAANGTYSFANIPPGNYRVVQTVPGGFNAIGDADGGNFTVIGNVTPINVLPGAAVTGRDFVNQAPGTISGTVRSETTGDLVGDVAQSGVVLTLLDSNGNNIDSDPGTAGVQPTTTTSAANGTYSFANIPPGNYRVAQTVPSGFTAIGDADGGIFTVIGNVTPISVLPGATVSGRDFVNQAPGTISGTVRTDTDGNSTGDTAQSGVVLTLKDSSGNDIDSDPGTAGVQPTTTTSAANGTYSFANLPPGNYQVVQTVPGGFTAIGDADAGDFTVIGNVTAINVPPGATVSGRDFVNQAPGAITGTVRADTDGNGSGDVALPNVTLTLKDSSGNDIDSDPGTAGVQPTTRTSAANGAYSFADLPPGNYRVVQTVPAGYVAINDVDGGDPTVIGSVTAINVLPGATVSGRDFVDAQLGAISGFVLTDNTGDTVGDVPQAGVTLTLKNGSGADIDSDPNTAGVQPTTTTTAGDGSYSFANLPPGSYRVVETVPANYSAINDVDGGDFTVIGNVAAINVLPATTVTGRDFVLRAIPGTIGGTVLIDTDLNGAGDTPLGNVTLTLVDAAGNPVLDGSNAPITTVTASNGTYRFNSVPVGTYGVRATPVADYLNIGDKDGTLFTWIGDVTDIPLAPGGESLDNDFLLRTQACPNTWAGWQTKWNDVADLTPTGNSDVDIHNNLIEYAFCLDPKSGRGTPYCMNGAPEAVDKVDLTFRRTAGGPLDVTFELEHAATLGTNSTTWTTVAIPPANLEVTPRTNGTDSVTIKDLEAITGLTAGTGFIRVKVTLRDLTNNNVLASASTDVGGWIQTPLNFDIRSFNDPFLQCPLFTGTISGIEGQNIVTEVSGGGIDYSTLLAGQTAYAEILTGPLQGHRFDVGGGSTNRFTAVVDNDIYSGAAPFSTVSAPQTGLVGAQFVVRSHRTVGGVFPPRAFITTDDPETASTVQLYAGNRWETFWLYNDGGEPGSEPAWIAVGDSSLTDRSGDVLVPGQGGFIYSRQGSVAGASFMLAGHVRPNDFIRPLKVGLNNVGGGYPLVQSPAGRAMAYSDPANSTANPNGFIGTTDFKTADQFLIWRMDTANTNAPVYDTWFLLNRTARLPILRYWTATSVPTLPNMDAMPYFKPDYSILIKRNNNNPAPANKMPSPWKP